MGSVEFDTRRYEREQAEGEALMEQAQAERGSLITEFLDERKNELSVMASLADVAGGDPEFLHALQRGDITRMRKLLRDNVDFAYGDDLVSKRADELGESC